MVSKMIVSVFILWDYNYSIPYSSKVTSDSLNIRVEYDSSLCRVDLRICINNSYSVETAAQQKDSPCNAIAWINIVHLNGFFTSKFYFLISLDTHGTELTTVSHEG